ncbi:LIM domain and actin-binding protein 1 [Geranomyces variabilis]|uniref:LIM domain and actin-binding protein 1 n=1 Tax=Geranomyces variabilis TaxID=109894 RepID=A0AAD5XJJ9_9FUNG|nr:LIM domain and actin-binding protein 1 [Geranomyces variabilis]
MSVASRLEFFKSLNSGGSPTHNAQPGSGAGSGGGNNNNSAPTRSLEDLQQAGQLGEQSQQQPLQRDGAFKSETDLIASEAVKGLSIKERIARYGTGSSSTDLASSKPKSASSGSLLSEVKGRVAAAAVAKSQEGLNSGDKNKDTRRSSTGAQRKTSNARVAPYEKSGSRHEMVTRSKSGSLGSLRRESATNKDATASGGVVPMEVSTEPDAASVPQLQPEAAQQPAATAANVNTGPVPMDIDQPPAPAPTPAPTPAAAAASRFTVTPSSASNDLPVPAANKPTAGSTTASSATPAAAASTSTAASRGTTPTPSKAFGAPPPKCEACNKSVYLMEQVTIDNHMFHKTCLKCETCKSTLKMGNLAAMNGVYYCKPHFKQLFKLKGNYAEGFGLEDHKKQWLEGAEGANDAGAAK